MASSVFTYGLVFAVILASSFVGYSSANPTFPFTYTEQGNNVVLTLRTKDARDQWLSVGFSANGMMVPSDVIVCEKGANTRCTDRMCTAKSECTVDATQNITTVITTEGDVTIFTVTRPKQTTDATDKVINSGQSIRMIWAWALGPTSTVHSEKGSFTPTLTSTPTTSNPTTPASSALSVISQLKTFSLLVVVVVSSLVIVL